MRPATRSEQRQRFIEPTLGTAVSMTNRYKEENLTPTNGRHLNLSSDSRNSFGMDGSKRQN